MPPVLKLSTIFWLFGNTFLAVFLSDISVYYLCTYKILKLLKYVHQTTLKNYSSSVSIKHLTEFTEHYCEFFWYLLKLQGASNFRTIL